MSPDRPLRRDAERNRVRILDAASDLMVRHGVGVALEDIAAEAGLGIGTLYRRFADRDALVRALFARHLDAVVALAEQALADDEHGDGIERFLTAVAEHQAAEHGLSQVLRTGAVGHDLAVEARRRITPVAHRLLARAQAAGTVAPSVGPADLVLVDLMISGVQNAGAEDDAAWRRALALVLTALRVGFAPAPDLDEEAIDRLQRQPRRP